MRLAETDAAVEEERVVAVAGVLRDGEGGGVRELVALARDEGVERVFRVERRGVARCDRRGVFVRAAAARLAGSGLLLPVVLRLEGGGVVRDDLAFAVEERRLLDVGGLPGTARAALAAGRLDGLLYLAGGMGLERLVLVARARQVEADELDTPRLAEDVSDRILEDGDVAVLDPVFGKIVRCGELERALIESDRAHGQQPLLTGHLGEGFLHFSEDFQPDGLQVSCILRHRERPF